MTGANSGIGLETTRGLARQGTTSSSSAGTLSGPRRRRPTSTRRCRAPTEIVLGDLPTRRRCAPRPPRSPSASTASTCSSTTPASRCTSAQTTSDGIDMMLAANHLGPFLLTSCLLPLLEASAPARIVNVASHAHRWGRIHFDDLQATRGYGFMSFPRYGETKLMNILFTRALARRLEGSGVTANCLHPGAVSTNIGAPGRSSQPSRRSSSSRRSRGPARRCTWPPTSRG